MQRFRLEKNILIVMRTEVQAHNWDHAIAKLRDPNTEFSCRVETLEPTAEYLGDVAPLEGDN